MQLLKKIFINWLIILGLLFGLTFTATASDDIDTIIVQAEQGDSTAQSILAARYNLGKYGVGQDSAKALYWFKKAADQGNTVSQYSLGHAYSNGQGVRQDHSKALYWFKKASDQNYAPAQYSLGIIYIFGRGIRQDRVQAKEWFGKACDNGNQNGCDQYKRLNEQGY